ncbi:hypothetical protein SALBM311S_09058 [Streptomyces alboniger]
MPRAVRFAEYGGIDVLNVVDVERPEPGERQVLVKVVAAGINPGEAAIRQGFLHDRFPATFPSGQGSDLAGSVEEVGAGVRGERSCSSSDGPSPLLMKEVCAAPSCTTREPTPPAAPETTTVSPRSALTACTAAYAVVPATKSAPACSRGTPAGRWMSWSSSTTTYSAWPALLWVKPITSSSMANPVRGRAGQCGPGPWACASVGHSPWPMSRTVASSGWDSSVSRARVQRTDGAATATAATAVFVRSRTHAPTACTPRSLSWRLMA